MDRFREVRELRKWRGGEISDGEVNLSPFVILNMCNREEIQKLLPEAIPLLENLKLPYPSTKTRKRGTKFFNTVTEFIEEWRDANSTNFISNQKWDLHNMCEVFLEIIEKQLDKWWELVSQLLDGINWWITDDPVSMELQDAIMAIDPKHIDVSSGYEPATLVVGTDALLSDFHTKLFIHQFKWVQEHHPETIQHIWYVIVHEGIPPSRIELLSSSLEGLTYKWLSCKSATVTWEFYEQLAHLASRGCLKFSENGGYCRVEETFLYPNQVAMIRRAGLDQASAPHIYYHPDIEFHCHVEDIPLDEDRYYHSDELYDFNYFNYPIELELASRFPLFFTNGLEDSEREIIPEMSVWPLRLEWDPSHSNDQWNSPMTRVCRDYAALVLCLIKYGRIYGWDDGRLVDDYRSSDKWILVHPGKSIRQITATLKDPIYQFVLDNCEIICPDLHWYYRYFLRSEKQSGLLSDYRLWEGRVHVALVRDRKSATK